MVTGQQFLNECHIIVKFKTILYLYVQSTLLFFRYTQGNKALYAIVFSKFNGISCLSPSTKYTCCALFNQKSSVKNANTKLDKKNYEKYIAILKMRCNTLKQYKNTNT